MQIWVHIINGCTDGQVKKRADCSFSFIHTHHARDRRILQLSGDEEKVRSTVKEFKRLGWFVEASLPGGHPTPAEHALVAELRGEP